MFRNFFKTALRVLWKRKSFSFLNIMGLGIGVAASLLIFLVIKNEFSYDDYHQNGKRIYRVVSTYTSRSNGEVIDRSSGTALPMADALRNDFPALEQVARVNRLPEAQIYVPGKSLGEEKRFKEQGGLFWVEPQFYKIFDFEWLSGNGDGLKDPNTVVLAESFAKRYYGSAAAAIGNTIQIYSFRIPLRVVGVHKDPPANSDIEIKFGASYMTHKNRMPDEAYTGSDAWKYNYGSDQCFILTGRELSAASLQTQFPGFVKKYYPEDPKFTRQLLLQPLLDMHLNSDYYTFKNDAISVKELWSLGLIGIFLLLVACINFINLSTAQSINRAKEIGVRKVIGSSRGQLIRQFLQETSLVTFLALLLGGILALMALPILNDLINKELSLNLGSNPSIIVYLLLLGIIITLLAGFYPALVLSGFKPAMIFKQKVTTKGSAGIYLRRGLVVFQFVIAQLLIIGTLVVIKQMHYFRNRPLGLNTDGIMLVNLPSDSSLRVKYPYLIEKMKSLPGVVSVSLCMESPSPGWEYYNSLYYNNEPEKKDYGITRQFGDSAYFRTFGIQLVAGRFPFASDTTREVVVNETTVKKLGLRSTQEVLGQLISFDGIARYPVVGVVKDYNSRSLHAEIPPVAISYRSTIYEWMAVRMERNLMSSAMEKVRKEFSTIYSTYLYDTYFFDERIEQFYRNEKITAKLFKVFSFLAIFISCLGLYGLVSFMAVQKTKEVGIRKVLGASVQSIVYLFSKEFTMLIAIAFALSTPLGYYFMHKWLSGFYYHTTIDGWIFFASIAFTIMLAWLAVGYKAIRAALVNPVKSLKSE